MVLSPMPNLRRRRTDNIPHATSGARLPSLVAPRLQLRWLEPDDLDDLYSVFADSDVTRFWSHAAWRDSDGRGESDAQRTR